MLRAMATQPLRRDLGDGEGSGVGSGSGGGGGSSGGGGDGGDIDAVNSGGDDFFLPDSVDAVPVGT